MSWLYRQCIRPLLFKVDPEHVHELTMNALGRVSRHASLCHLVEQFCGAPELPVELWGLRFPNPVGLAAGMDKLAEAVPVWPAFGFGHAELGATTWHAQPGNPKPRVFRAIPESAIINRMGFNNPGAEAIAQKLQGWKNSGRWPAHPVGINLGKSKITPLDQAPEDYARSFHVLWPWADFFVVNVSSPNTPDLRKLQDKQALDEILACLQEAQQKRLGTHGAGRGKPILVKVAPDLTFEAMDEILELVGPRSVAGIIATNTTITRPPSTHPDVARVYTETGGLSGKPLRRRSTEVIRHLYRQTRGTLPIIGVGGIFTAEDAWEKIQAGATMVQIYTGFIYQGPMAVRSIVTGLIEKLKAGGFKRLTDAVGTMDTGGK